METSKFINGDKKATIQREEFTYTISYYLNDRIVRKEVVSDGYKAEELAEDYIMSESRGGPSLLNENS